MMIGDLDVANMVFEGFAGMKARLERRRRALAKRQERTRRRWERERECCAFENAVKSGGDPA